MNRPIGGDCLFNELCGVMAVNPYMYLKECLDTVIDFLSFVHEV